MTTADLRALMREREFGSRARLTILPQPAANSTQRAGIKLNGRRVRQDPHFSYPRIVMRGGYLEGHPAVLIAPKGGVRGAVPSERSSQWADDLNAHFATVGSRVAAALEAARTGADRLPPRPTRVVSGAFRVRTATLPELSVALQRMSTSKACGG